MKTVQMYHLHLIGGEVIPVAEAYGLKGKKTIPSIYQNADDEDILCITDMILGSCYVPKKNIVYITTGNVKENAERDNFETNVVVIRRGKKSGSKN